MGGVVVEDGMDDFPRRNGPLDRIEELDEFLMPVLLHTTHQHGAVQDVEGGKQGGGAVALVIVGHGGALTRLQRQARLGAVESLDLALLINGQHHGVARRLHVEADHILDFFGEGGVLGFLESAQPVWLETVGIPDPLDRPQANANGRGPSNG